MKTRAPHSRPRTFALIALASILACHSDSTGRYTSERDDLAMAAIASAWAEAGGGVALTLCEDVDRTAAWAPRDDDCVVDHVVRGGGMGVDHVERHEGGCGAGGCPWNVVAWVKGTVSGPGLVGDVPVSGSVWLQTADDHDPYGYPYTLDLACDGAPSPCQVTGSLHADGSVAATLVLEPSGPGRSETPHALARSGPALCP